VARADGDEARLELHVDGPMARAELIWPEGYGTRLLAYGPFPDVMERVIECGRYGVGCGPLASNRPHQWLAFEQDGSYRAVTPRGELRLLPFLSKFALVHVPTDGGVVWLSLHEELSEVFSSAFAVVGSTRPRPLTVRYRGQVFELTVASIRGVIAYCRLDPRHDLLLIPVDDEHVELVLVGVAGGTAVTVAVIPVHELGHREELWSDEPPQAAPRGSAYELGRQDERWSARLRPAPRVPVHTPPPSPDRTDAPSPAPRSTSSGHQTRRPPPITCRCKVPVDVLERIRFRAHQIAALKPSSPNDPTGWAIGVRRALAEGVVRLAARGRDIRGSGRELRQALEKALGYRLPGGARSFRYAVAAYRRYSKLVRIEGRQIVFAFSDLQRSDSELMRWLLRGQAVEDFEAEGTDDFAAEAVEDDVSEDAEEYAEEDGEDAGDGAAGEAAGGGEVGTVQDEDGGDADGEPTDDATEADDDELDLSHQTPQYKPKFLFYQPKYYKDIFTRERERQGDPPAPKAIRKKPGPSDN
jgi:hypothetical protein